MQKALDKSIEAVVAVACEHELKEGIRTCPKPVLAVVNARPNGPCFETDVAVDDVEAAILHFIGS